MLPTTSDSTKAMLEEFLLIFNIIRSLRTIILLILTNQRNFMKRHTESIPIVLLSLYTLKLLIFQNWSFENAIVLLALAGVSALFQFKAKNEEIKELRDILDKHTIDLQKLQKQDENLQSSVTSMKIAVQSKAPAMKF